MRPATGSSSGGRRALADPQPGVQKQKKIREFGAVFEQEIRGIGSGDGRESR
jgi:hypothetical protein